MEIRADACCDVRAHTRMLKQRDWTGGEVGWDGLGLTCRISARTFAHVAIGRRAAELCTGSVSRALTAGGKRAEALDSVPAMPISEGAAPCPIYTRPARIIIFKKIIKKKKIN